MPRRLRSVRRRREALAAPSEKGHDPQRGGRGCRCRYPTVIRCPRRSKLASSDREVRAEATFPAGPRPNEVPRRRFVDRGKRIVGPAVGLGLLATLVVIAVPGLKFAYRSDETHVAIETAAFLIPGL